jgi:hypothetical protein
MRRFESIAADIASRKRIRRTAPSPPRMRTGSPPEPRRTLKRLHEQPGSGVSRDFWVSEPRVRHMCLHNGIGAIKSSGLLRHPPQIVS